jgi:hypothetical protein
MGGGAGWCTRPGDDAEEVAMGQIGTERREVEFEPLPDEATPDPQPEPEPVPTVPERT